MIVRSSNLTTNALIALVGPQNANATAHELGARNIKVLRGVEDQKAFDRGLNNTTDAAALATIFTALGRGEAVSASASREMIGILKRQKHNTGIPAGLPPGIEVAHKTGTITRIHHDAGIVYARRPYVLVVLVRGMDDENASATVIADISRIVWMLGQ
jgi:beta-lactamase class A